MVIGMRPVHRRKRYYWAPRIVATAVVLFPLSVNKIDFRNVFGHGLAIATYKASPAYAAFEDLNQAYSAKSRLPEKFETLSAGQHSYVPPRAEVSVRRMAMKGLTIKAPIEKKPQPFYVAGQTKFQNLPSSVGPSPALSDRDGRLLPLEQRKQVLAQQIRSEDWTVPTPAQVAAQLVAKAKDQKIIRSSTGTPIIVARGTVSSPTSPNIKDEKAETIEESKPSFVPTVATIEPTQEQQRPLWLNGQVEMTGGLAFVGRETQMIVKRVVDGQTYEKGRIWVTEGRFEIHVKSAVGQLVAELVTQEGRVLGRGEMNLVHLKDIPARDNKIYDIRIALRPTAEGATLRTVSGYSHGQQMMPIKGARVEIQNYTEPQKVNDEGFASEPTLNSKSTYVARASAPKHWSSIVVGQAEHPQDIRLFANNMVEALLDLQTTDLGERKVAGKSGVVWGQIRRDGKAAEGVSVQMAGNYQPIYFNAAYLPDPKLTATTANGLFAFINVRRGVQALRVQVENRVFPAQVFPTEDKHVSYVELELQDRIVTQFKVVDALNLAAPMESRIRLVGTEEFVPLRHSGMVEYSNGANPFMVEAESTVEYEISRMTLVGRPQTVVVPMVKREWLMRIFNSQNILALPGRGIIVGFVDDEDFEIELTGYGPQERMQIVYFDRDGNILSGRKNGVAGGGFAIFNAPMGLQTVYVHPLQSRETFSQIVVAEPEYVHVLTYQKPH